MKVLLDPVVIVSLFPSLLGCDKSNHFSDTGTETDTKKQEETSIESTLDGYETTKKILVENYVPNSNVNVERMKFRASQPSVGDSHKQFLEKLKKKARYCGFDNGYRLV